VKKPEVEFVISAPQDMLNAMYFASLVVENEGVEGWPVEVRKEMAPDLLAELDFLFNYPAGDPGIMGTLSDDLFLHREACRDIDALIAYVQAMPDGVGELDTAPGIQGLIYETVFRYPDGVDRDYYDSLPPRQAIEERVRSLGDRDVETAMRYYDRPAELRARMVVLISRFYAEHYEKEMPKRLPALERGAAAHRQETIGDPVALAKRLTGRGATCLEGYCLGPFDRLVFSPSMDMGAYNSCAVVGGVHGLFYPLEPEFMDTPVDVDETRRARVFKALSDEQRLRILRMLRGREMYAQEIVEATGIHQSVVSRHLSFMKAVGLLDARRQNNMKYFSINPAVRDDLERALDFVPPAGTTVS
jgi:DNA-binding transcriptional ArsR family regulator